MKPHGVWVVLETYKVLFVLGAVVVVGGAGYLIWSNGNGNIQTLTVTRGDFVQQVSVSGRVMADQEVDLGFSQSGRISGVYVKEGQAVARGALVAEIENGDLYAALVQRRAALDRAETQLEALKRGTRPEEIAIQESTVAANEAALKAARQALVDAILSSYATSDSAVFATTDQLFSNPGSTPQLTFQVSNGTLETLVESERGAIGLTLASWQNANAGLPSKADLSAPAVTAQAYLADVSKYLSDVSAALAASIPTSSVSQATLDGYKTAVATARANVNTAVATLTAAQKSLAAAESALTTSERDLALKKAGATHEDIRAQEASVTVAEADVLSATAQLEKTQIRAPFSGIVTKIDAKVGGSAAPGVPLVSLIGTGTFQIESFIPELTVVLVEPGDSARVTFDSYGPGVEFVADVVSIDRGETTRDGVTTYRTVLAFREDDERIRSGMTANVVITTESKTDVIALPQLLVERRGTDTYVRVKVGESVEERAVSVGAVSSFGDIEILSGLVPGDLVVVP